MISVVIGSDSARDALHVAMESELPASLPARTATALFCFGHCFHVTQTVAGLVLLVDGVPHRPAATRMPRRDLFEWLHGNKDVDPAGHSYRSGFWATLPLPAQATPGTISIDAAIKLEDGRSELVSLGSIDVVQPDETDTTASPNDGLITVAMATFEPDIKLFRDQVESLRAQTDPHWRCVISDDRSSPERFDAMTETLAGDPRFVSSRAPKRRGPYRNFERALTLALPGAELVALCDQDDRWYPQKLSLLRARLGDAQLVYCDQRLVTSDGRVLRASLWEGRHRDHENLASMLVANSVPGAAALFRRQVVERALPFPDAPGPPYHDHWLALVALASGEIAYVDEPLYDYTQHSGAVTGAVLDTPAAPRSSGSRGLRGAYFGGYIARQVLAQTLLLRCGAMLTKRKRRALEWYVESERSVLPFAWLALRPLRRVIGHDETLGGETAIVKGLLWRWLLPVAVWRARLPGRRPFDAMFPDPPEFEQRRLRRWLRGA